jgi:Flp pilus assembly protein protease CpaA
MMTVSGAVLGIVSAVIAAVRNSKLSADEERKSAWRKKAMPYGVAIGLTGVVYFAYIARGIVGL